MIKSDHSHYGKPLIMLYPGEHLVTSEDVVFSTVAGSCLVVTLNDKQRAIGGLGHFILPGQIGTGGITHDEVAAYGITQLEYLFGEFVKLGSRRENLTADVFGAAALDNNMNVNEAMQKSNIAFIHTFFTAEHIPIHTLDLAGSQRRKIVYFPRTGKTFRKILTNNESNSEIIRLEQEYINSAFHELREKTQYVLFNK
ncbi:MAG: hypothetical protein PF637_07705 [Spirochaetes bacterium]|jgi:chemotaxis protein CheD|nr:hypothetical protein [Spirochaetota bacterium]